MECSFDGRVFARSAEVVRKLPKVTKKVGNLREKGFVAVLDIRGS